MRLSRGSRFHAIRHQRHPSLGSNFRSDDRDYEDAVHIETSLGIPVLRHDEKKPGGVMDVLAFFEGKGLEGADVRSALTGTPFS